MGNIKSQIESLLFISAKAMTLKSLADLIEVSVDEIEVSGEEMIAAYKENGGGMQIIRNGNSLQMVSAPENAKLIQDFIKDETTGELSRPSLETLTIIAYRGPIAKLDIDRIRGINCSLILRNLLLRGLIEAKPDKAKHETYYAVTLDFVRFLGLNDVKDLPDYERLSKDDTIDRMLDQPEVSV
ncbi:SMC-Scp complex subunit ScpB [Candidatus Falkowbacteria bacterium]|nr:SMC-Scp complex subunit ScpB [Candidatus Falkowbacteria bacterium]